LPGSRMPRGAGPYAPHFTPEPLAGMTGRTSLAPAQRGPTSSTSRRGYLATRGAGSANSLRDAFEGDLEEQVLYCGQSCALVNDIKSAAQIVRDLVEGAEALLRRGPGDVEQAASVLT
jgi:NAD(P)H-dependent flavin oxidoreductase YrpB (nitropropane dioxygenase family)